LLIFNFRQLISAQVSASGQTEDSRETCSGPGGPLPFFSPQIALISAEEDFSGFANLRSSAKSAGKLSQQRTQPKQSSVVRSNRFGKTIGEFAQIFLRPQIADHSRAVDAKENWF